MYNIKKGLKLYQIDKLRGWQRLFMYCKFQFEIIFKQYFSLRLRLPHLCPNILHLQNILLPRVFQQMAESRMSPKKFLNYFHKMFFLLTVRAPEIMAMPRVVRRPKSWLCHFPRFEGSSKGSFSVKTQTKTDTIPAKIAG